MKPTASDRSALVNLAGTLPKGSAERRTILAGLKKAYGEQPPLFFKQRLIGGKRAIVIKNDDKRDVERMVKKVREALTYHTMDYDFESIEEQGDQYVAYIRARDPKPPGPENPEGWFWRDMENYLYHLGFKPW